MRVINCYMYLDMANIANAAQINPTQYLMSSPVMLTVIVDSVSIIIKD